MDVKKVYVVSHGTRDGSFFACNEIEEWIEKVFTTKEKALEYIKSESKLDPDEHGYVEFNRDEYSEDDADYEFYSMDEYDLE